MEYGPSFRVIQELFCSPNEALARIQLPSHLEQDAGQFVLHPCIVDSALQTIIGLTQEGPSDGSTLYLPFSIGQLDIVGPFSYSGYALATQTSPAGAKVAKFDIQLTDETGKVFLRIKEFTARSIQSEMKEEQSNVQDVLEAHDESAQMNKTELQQKTEDYLKKLISEILKLSPDKIQSRASFEKYGIDSMMIMNLNRKLEQIFGDLPKTLFFEYQTLEALVEYFIENHASVLMKELSIGKTDIKNSVLPVQPASVHKKLHRSHRKLHLQVAESVAPKDIAIIGLSGRYPQANDLDVFWENLKSGKDCITEIPKERWDHALYFDADKSKFGKTYSKWGGFIDDVDKFDPLFFNISPREAELMDPQERLFLETTWKTVEDAGYSRESLSDKQVGVFVGVMYGEYQLYGPEASQNGMVLATSSSYASIANRVSYFLNFHGPSIALDTMCSSSLTSIHLACKSIRDGECDLAIAGGVNVTIHPNKYIFLAQGKFLSSDGHCKSFGEGGEGYVPGEGVGAVLLKSLDQAIADKDHIYGVIKGSSLNHGGKTNGYTVPNPVAQAELIKAALTNAGIDPETISYVEAHGTGTSLGDPIEINGLNRAFGTRQAQCVIGSVKSNIGHLESAAGIAAVTKVLLQMQHKQLVPSILSETLNPNIEWDKTIFKVQHTLSEWSENEYPRRAAISSFGAGGTNAHLIIEEAPPDHTPIDHAHKPYYLVTLSAKTENSLKQRIEDLAAWVSRQAPDAISLEDVSYTLNEARSHFGKRCGLVVSSISDLQETLRQLKTNQIPKNAYLHSGNEQPHDQAIFNKIFKQTMQELAEANQLSPINYRENLLALANFYVEGYDLDWELLHQSESKRKIPLPTYPFEKNRYWVSTLPVSDPIPDSQETKKIGLYYYEPKWIQEALAPATTEFLRGPILIFNDEAHIINVLQRKFPDEVILEVKSDKTYQEKDLKYFINVNQENDYVHLINTLKKQNLLPKVIIFQTRFSITDTLTDDIIQDQLNHGYYALFYLIKTLIRENLQEQIRILCVNENKEGNHSIFTEALSGFVKTVHAETTNLLCQIVEIPELGEKGIDLLLQEINNHALDVYYDHNDVRWIKRTEELPAFKSGSNLILKKGGIYLITGGAGGLGLIFARYLAEHYQAKLILIGRSEYKEKQISIINELERLGGEAIYLKADVTNRNDLQSVFNEIQSRFGHLNGVIHAAGVAKPNLIINKDLAEIETILNPKIKGTIYLDELTQTESLDFFVLFSSMASVLGDEGLSDYAYANAFMDSFAYRRNQLRSGKSLSINWTFWQEGGMQIAGNEINDEHLKATQTRLEHLFGLTPLTTSDGIQFFTDALSYDTNQIMILTGFKNSIDHKIELTSILPNVLHEA
ncbi:MAG: SDR family NAD(P)-dependent oxidoreductase, partial [Gammaproteobacteria bacterium]